MKNYKVIATRFFKDSNEIDEKTGLKAERQVNDEFYCTKERYEFLKANNAVKLVEILEVEKIEYSTLADDESKEIETIITNEIVEEKEQWAVTEEDGNIHVRPVVDGKIIDTPIEETITYKEPKPKKKKSNKK